ncbi:MAG: response regulator [Spartobacteria bacterium]|nr:response regulator [Spartobacteria bacterium]
MNILIAEDEHTARAILTRMLEREGHRVTVAENGEEALAKLAEDKDAIDLLITDIIMPVMDGMELLKAVSEQYALLPVIVLTAKEDRNTVKQALKLGASDFLDKPIRQDDLHEAIETVIADTSRKDLKKTVQTSRHVRAAQNILMQSAASPKDLDPRHISYWFKPKSDAGGDIFIGKKLNEHTYSLILADMAGHDVTSSYLAAQFKGLVSGLSEYLTSPARFLKELNEKLLEMEVEGSHVCAMCLVWDIETGHIELANAGLPHPYLLQRTGPLCEIPLDGMLLGLFPDAIFDRMELNLRPKERLLLFSDGLDALDNTDILRITWPMTREISPVGSALSHLVDLLHLEEMQAEDDMILVATEEPPYPPERTPPPLHTCLDLRIHSSIHLVEPVLRHLAEFLGCRHDLTREFTAGLLFATREIIINAIRHGNLEIAEKTVHVLAAADDGTQEITISIQDQGPGFDLSGMLLFEENAPPLRDGKRGLIGAAAFAQDIKLKGNQVIMHFQKHAATGDTG